MIGMNQTTMTMIKVKSQMIKKMMKMGVMMITVITTGVSAPEAVARGGVPVEQAVGVSHHPHDINPHHPLLQPTRPVLDDPYVTDPQITPPILLPRRCDRGKQYGMQK